MFIDGSLTSRFPSLDDIKRNATLLDKYTTYDGEMRSIPSLKASECLTINKITFIALPGAKDADDAEDTELIIEISGSNHSIKLNDSNQSIGDFGYELLNVELPESLNLSDIKMFWISQPDYEETSLRLLHQVGNKMFNIEWQLVDGPDDSYNETTCDYPLLAIETGIHIH